MTSTLLLHRGLSNFADPSYWLFVLFIIVSRLCQLHTFKSLREVAHVVNSGYLRTLASSLHLSRTSHSDSEKARCGKRPQLSFGEGKSGRMSSGRAFLVQYNLEKEWRLLEAAERTYGVKQWSEIGTEYGRGSQRDVALSRMR